MNVCIAPRLFPLAIMRFSRRTASHHCRIILSDALLIIIFHLITLASSSDSTDGSSGLFHNIANRKPVSTKIVADYSTWLSPITSDVAAGSEVQFDGLERDGCLSELSDTIYWVESRPAEDGRSSWKPVDRIVVPWTPENFSVQSTVHEFGGGTFCVYKGIIYFVNKSDQRIYMQRSPSDTPHPVTQHDPYRRFADLHYSEQFDCLIAVCEDKGDRKSAKERNRVEYHHTKAKNLTESYIVAINISTGELTCLVYGADFYSSPRTTPLFDGILVWMEWSFPNMHWDNTTIKWATLNGSLKMATFRRVHRLRAANGKSDVMFALPQFTSNGELLYISDEDNWRNLWKTNLAQTKKIRLEKVSKDLCDPLWIFGMHPYSVLPSSNQTHIRVALTYGDDLSVVELKNSKQRSNKEVFTQRSIPTGLLHHTPYVQAVQSGTYSIGYDAKTPMTLLYTDSKSGKTTHVRRGSKLSLEGYLSEPEGIEIPTTNNEVAYGYYYPPVNKNYEAAEGTTPPLRVRIHGGPTARTYAHLSLDTQFFTSRGFAVLDVNYRGSDGYGRKYRQQLYGKWGVSDVEDAVNGAKYLVSLGKADPNRLVIIGGSAGGLTVLNSLIHYDTFKAGASYYGVADLETISAVTDKLQLHHLDILVGPYPEAKVIIEQRSPYHNREKLNRPVIFFQGTKDNVVPPSQSRKMYEAVKAKGLPTAYVSFEGEGHGFVKKENIKKALEAECAFYLTVFGMEAPSVPNGVKFDNRSYSACLPRH